MGFRNPESLFGTFRKLEKLSMRIKINLKASKRVGKLPMSFTSCKLIIEIACKVWRGLGNFRLLLKTLDSFGKLQVA